MLLLELFVCGTKISVSVENVELKSMFVEDLTPVERYATIKLGQNWRKIEENGSLFGERIRWQTKSFKVISNKKKGSKINLIKLW